MSLEAITSEMQTHVPDLYRMFMQLGDVSEDDSDDVTMQMMKATSSLCCLLNARSMRAKGFPLLMGLMLIASRHVCTIVPGVINKH